jgi:hypothetical protein
MSYGLKVNQGTLFEVTYRDHDGELLVGFALSEEEANNLAISRELRLYLEERRKQGKPHQDYEEAKAEILPRLKIRLALYAIVRASG